MRVVITWLDILVCLATAAAITAYYVLHMETLTISNVTIIFVTHGIVISIVYVALELLSAAVGEGGNMVLYWLSYIASWSVPLAATFAMGYLYLGLEQNYQPVVLLLAVPYAKGMLWFLLLFGWFSATVLQGHKHRSAWQHVASARNVAPATPIPPTIPTTIVAPTVPSSAVSIVLVCILLLILGVLAWSSMFGGFHFTTFGLFESGRRVASIGDDKGVCFDNPVYIGKSDGVKIFHTIPRPCD